MELGDFFTIKKGAPITLIKKSGIEGMENPYEAKVMLIELDIHMEGEQPYSKVVEFMGENSTRNIYYVFNSDLHPYKEETIAEQLEKEQSFDHLPKIIAVSGKIGSGKDQFAITLNEMTGGLYKVKKFAAILKKMTALILNVPVEKLEDREFKNTPLGPEWVRYIEYANCDTLGEKPLRIYTEREVNEKSEEITLHLDKEQLYIAREVLTPRKIMLLLGTDAGRDIIHPDIWVNAFWAAYTPTQKKYRLKRTESGRTWDETFDSYEEFSDYVIMMTNYPKSYSKKRIELEVAIIFEEFGPIEETPTYWVITDTRFFNELDSAKERGALTVRMNRKSDVMIDHPSETELDNATFDLNCDNNGGLDDLARFINDNIINV